MIRALPAAILLSAVGVAVPAAAVDQGWSFVTRDQGGVVVERARRSTASAGDLIGAVFRFRPTRGTGMPNSYRIAANCAAGTMLVAPVDASAGTADWLRISVHDAAFRVPVVRSVGADIVAELCRTDDPGAYAQPSITLSAPPPVQFVGDKG